jgi:hypothetical protein
MTIALQPNTTLTEAAKPHFAAAGQSLPHAFTRQRPQNEHGGDSQVLYSNLDLPFEVRRWFANGQIGHSIRVKDANTGTDLDLSSASRAHFVNPILKLVELYRQAMGAEMLPQDAMPEVKLQPIAPAPPGHFQPPKPAKEVIRYETRPQIQEGDGEDHHAASLPHASTLGPGHFNPPPSEREVATMSGASALAAYSNDLLPAAPVADPAKEVSVAAPETAVTVLDAPEQPKRRKKGE